MVCIWVCRAELTLVSTCCCFALRRKLRFAINSCCDKIVCSIASSFCRSSLLPSHSIQFWSPSLTACSLTCAELLGSWFFGQAWASPTLASRPRNFRLSDHAQKTTEEIGKRPWNKRTYREINGVNHSTSIYVRLIDHATEKYTM